MGKKGYLYVLVPSAKDQAMCGGAGLAERAWLFSYIVMG